METAQFVIVVLVHIVFLFFFYLSMIEIFFFLFALVLLIGFDVIGGIIFCLNLLFLLVERLMAFDIKIELK